MFIHYGVELWVPEVGGKVDPGSDAHDMVMSLYGGMSKGERNRIKVRVRSAMASQAAIEGRFLGGRPPYGYLLGDAGPHPNPSKAANGQRLRRLKVDPIAAPVVQRIFDEYLRRIEDSRRSPRVSPPTASSPLRSRPRTQPAPIHRPRLGQVRRAGHHREPPLHRLRQVWNRQRRDEVLLDVDDVAPGHQTKMRWNHPSEWIWSADLAHEPSSTPAASTPPSSHVPPARNGRTP